jgi:hypothetical protein
MNAIGTCPTPFLPNGTTIGIVIIPLMLAAPLIYPIAGSASIAAIFATREFLAACGRSAPSI